MTDRWVNQFRLSGSTYGTKKKIEIIAIIFLDSEVAKLEIKNKNDQFVVRTETKAISTSVGKGDLMITWTFCIDAYKITQPVWANNTWNKRE